ncbi:MAG: hypothetical protein AB8B72_03640 [Crocinitomicaceae bacterium]
MKNNLEKPSPEAKALSLFLMAHKNVGADHKENASYIKELWSMVLNGKLDQRKYLQEVSAMIKFYGGYDKVVEKTVKHFIDKTGEWKAGGDDQFSKDAQAIADRILKK